MHYMIQIAKDKKTRDENIKKSYDSYLGSEKVPVSINSEGNCITVGSRLKSYFVCESEASEELNNRYYINIQTCKGLSTRMMELAERYRRND